MNKFVFYYATYTSLGIAYAYVFSQGMSAAPDRGQYIIFFDDPSSSRFEPLFVYYGRLAEKLGFAPQFSVYLTAFILFSLAFIASKKLYANIGGKYTTFPVSFGVVFFGVNSIFSFAQLRAGVAIWLFLLLFSILHKNKSLIPSRIKVIILLVPGFWHYLVLFSSIWIFFRFRMRFTIFIITILIVIFFQPILELTVSFLALSPYYVAYANELVNPNLLTSITVISYLIIAGYLFFSKAYSKISYGEISLVPVPFVIGAAFLGYDIFMKFMAPFIIFAWYLGFANFFTRQRGDLNVFYGKSYLSVVLLCASLAYSFIKWT